MLKAQLGWLKQHEIILKKPTVDPAASNADTIVDSIVTVYLIHTDIYRYCRLWQGVVTSYTIFGVVQYPRKMDLTLPARTQTSEQKYNDLLVNSILLQSPSKAFLEQGRNEKGARRAQFPGRQSLWGRRMTAGDAKWLRRAPKSPNNVASTFFNAVHLLPKDLGFEHGAPNLFLAPGAI